LVEIGGDGLERVGGVAGGLVIGNDISSAQRVNGFDCEELGISRTNTDSIEASPWFSRVNSSFIV